MESVVLLQQSLVIMMAGLFIVFLFLTLLILFIKLNQFFIRFSGFDRTPVRPSTEDWHADDQSLVSAITIAVLEYERDTM